MKDDFVYVSLQTSQVQKWLNPTHDASLHWNLSQNLYIHPLVVHEYSHILYTHTSKNRTRHTLLSASVCMLVIWKVTLTYTHSRGAAFKSTLNSGWLLPWKKSCFTLLNIYSLSAYTYHLYLYRNIHTFLICENPFCLEQGIPTTATPSTVPTSFSRSQKAHLSSHYSQTQTFLLILPSSIELSEISAWTHCRSCALQLPTFKAKQKNTTWFPSQPSVSMPMFKFILLQVCLGC